MYLVEDLEEASRGRAMYAMKAFPPIKLNQENLSNSHHGNLTTSHQETIIRREIAIMRRLIHPNVVYLRDVSLLIVFFFVLIEAGGH